MSTELHRWRKAATTDEWAQLAKLVFSMVTKICINSSVENIL